MTERWRRLVGIGSLGIATACAGRGHATTAPSPARDALRTLIDSMVADAKFRSAHWGVLIVDPERGDTLYSHNAGKLFMPASNQKIITGAVALAQLGPQFRFGTTFVAMGPIADGTLTGDLIVHGTGDPSLNDRLTQNDPLAPLRAIADSIAARGIKRITGSIRKGDDTFPDATFGFGWSWDDLDAPYSAGVDELFFAEGFTRVIVRAGARVGDRATARTTPARTYPQVRVFATTSAAADTARGGRRSRLEVRQDSGGVGVVVLGSISAGDSAVLSITHRDPSEAYLAALREVLADRGVSVDGPVIAQAMIRSSAGSSDGSRVAWEPAGTPLFTAFSPPLSDVLKAFEKPSQNQIGEILVKTLGRVKTGVGTADSGLRVIRTQLTAWGVAPDGVVPRDGSGLSRYDLVTPETIIRVLDAARRDTAFTVFYDALPIAGVDGTIGSRMRDTPAQGNVHAKTGTLNGVRSLSGYVTTASGRRLLFSILCNNYIVPTREVDRVADTIAIRLASLER
jgi:serine-type D-Ala-D-Ala carboxypeptidase/endopeptidase (penicillin-binding protein 4)